METDTNRAEGQARAQYEGIKEMLARLNHALECNGDEDCPLLAPEIADAFWKRAMYEWDLERGDREEYHDEEKAREAILEDPLGVQVRSGWHSPGDSGEAEEYEILLCTGGPAARIIGDLGRYNDPADARLQYQDWGTPWTDYHTGDMETLLEYARHFWFGE